MTEMRDLAVRAAELPIEPAERDGGAFRGLLTPDGVAASLLQLPIDDSAASDLNLDQIATAVAGDDEEAELIREVLLVGSRDRTLIEFRQEIFRDLEAPAVNEILTRFVHEVTYVRSRVTGLDNKRSLQQAQGWFLDAASHYCESVLRTAEELGHCTLDSRGLRAFRAYLASYAASDAFVTLAAETTARKADLARVEYCIRINQGRVDVSRYEGEADYSTEVLAVFERFAQGTADDYQIVYRDWPTMNHIGAKILDFVAKLFAEEFSALDTYCARHRDFFDPGVGQFAREASFYFAYLEYIAPIRATGLSFCYPRVSSSSKRIEARSTFDLALARKCVAEGTEVVSNDVSLGHAERIVVVSGPNQGGKTTFARTFGQLHHLAAVGCPVPGTRARLFLCDRIFTHFEREEDLATMTGKLEDDLVRIKEVLRCATSDSIIVTNEIFTSTSLVDARFLGREVLGKVVERDALCVYVTFVEDLATYGPTVVSMVSTVDPRESTRRTYKVVRAVADGKAYALSIAERYGLTYENLIARIQK